MSERRLLVKVEAERYRRARKKEKGWILDDLIALSDCNRWYAVGVIARSGQGDQGRAPAKAGGRLRPLDEATPFPLQGIDSDNGSEFINNHLLRYCQQEKITFTRGRAWKKNDGCFVGQKNYSVVRRAVGYARYDSPAQQRLLNTLYAHPPMASHQVL